MLLARIDDVPSTRPSSQVKEHLRTQAHRQIQHFTGGFRFSVPASTVGRWLSRFAGRAEALRQAWAGVLAWVDAQARPVAAAGPVVADALAVLQAVTAGLRTRFAGLATVAAHEVAAHLTGGMLLAPVLPPVAGNTNWFLVAAAKGS
jgi:hypothetical protein